MKFNSSEAFIKSEISIAPVPVAADFLGVTSSMINELVRSKEIVGIIIKGKDKKWKGISKDSLIKYKEKKNEEMSDVTMSNKIKKRLETCAKSGETIIYSELMKQVGLKSTNPHHRKIIGEYLGRISENTFRQNGFMLSVLAVLKNSGLPNDSFFGWAKELGVMKSTNNMKKFFYIHKKKVFEYYKDR